jgi:tripartite-type tricarboxylate transporter receptor subunit TctC
MKSNAVKYFLSLIILALLVWRFVPTGENSDQWPQRTIRIVVPYGAGGGTDTFVRKVEPIFKQENLLPQSITILNQAGGGGTIGTLNVIDAAPDGYKLLCHHEAMLTAKLSGVVDFGSEDLLPIIQTGKVILVVVVRADSRFTDLKSLLNEAAAKPNTINFGADAGSDALAAALSLEKHVAGAKMKYIPSAGGAKRLTNLLGGHLDAAIFNLGEYHDFLASNDTPASENINAIASFDSERHPSVPELATCTEQGFPVVANNAYYWFAPKGTPQHIVETMRVALEKAFTHPNLIKELDELSIDPVMRSGSELDEYLKSRITALGSVMTPTTLKTADFPLYTIIIVAILFFLMLILKHPPEDQMGGEKQSSRFNKPATLSLIVFALTIIALQFNVPFILVISISIFLIGNIIAGWDKAHLLPLAQTALLFALGTELIFTRLFTVPLP